MLEGRGLGLCRLNVSTPATFAPCCPVFDRGGREQDGSHGAGLPRRVGGGRAARPRHGAARPLAVAGATTSACRPNRCPLRRHAALPRPASPRTSALEVRLPHLGVRAACCTRPPGLGRGLPTPSQTASKPPATGPNRRLRPPSKASSPTPYPCPRLAQAVCLPYRQPAPSGSDVLQRRHPAPISAGSSFGEGQHQKPGRRRTGDCANWRRAIPCWNSAFAPAVYR